jgi:hypothetical protein
MLKGSRSACRSPMRSLMPAFLSVILCAVASPLEGQTPRDDGSRTRVTVQPQMRGHFHPYQPGWGLGVRLGAGGDRWSFGISANRLVNDIESAPAPVGELSPDNVLARAEQFRDVSIYGIDASWMFHRRPSYSVGLGLLSGAISMVRVKEIHELIGFDAGGQPVTLLDIGTGREVNMVAEPSVRYERYVVPGVRIGVDAGYLWTSRPWSEDSRFSAMSVRMGFSFAIS